MCDEKRADTNRKKILLVDDDADFIAMNRKILEENGYEVSVAYSGKECLEQVKSEKPDLILLDLALPDMTGPEVLALLKRKKRSALIPVVGLSGVMNRKLMAKAMHSYAEACLMKPIEMTVLESNIARILSRTRTSKKDRI